MRFKYFFEFLFLPDFQKGSSMVFYFILVPKHVGALTSIQFLRWEIVESLIVDRLSEKQNFEKSGGSGISGQMCIGVLSRVFRSHEHKRQRKIETKMGSFLLIMGVRFGWTRLILQKLTDFAPWNECYRSTWYKIQKSQHDRMKAGKRQRCGVIWKKMSL